MATMTAQSEETLGGRSGPDKPMLARRTTTLYALMTALQEQSKPEHDCLLVATVAHLCQSGRLTWSNPSSAAAQVRARGGPGNGGRTVSMPGEGRR